MDYQRRLLRVWPTSPLRYVWATIPFDVGRDYAMWATITVKQKMRPTSQRNPGPHHTGISGPGIGLVKAGQGLKYLHALNTHLAVPSDVKASGCLCEIGIWEEGLHR